MEKSRDFDKELEGLKEDDGCLTTIAYACICIGFLIIIITISMA